MSLRRLAELTRPSQVRRYWPLAGQWARSLNVLCARLILEPADSADDLYCRASLVGEIPTDAKPVRARVMALLQQGDPTQHLDEGTVSAGPSSPRIAPRGIAVGAAPPQQLRFNLFALLKARDTYPPPPSSSTLLQPAIMPLFDPIASTSMPSPMPPLLAPSSVAHAFSPPSFALGSFGDPTLGFGALPGPATGSDDLDFAAALGLGAGGDQLDWSLFAGPSWFTQPSAMF